LIEVRRPVYVVVSTGEGMNVDFFGIYQSEGALRAMTTEVFGEGSYWTEESLDNRPAWKGIPSKMSEGVEHIYLLQLSPNWSRRSRQYYILECYPA
jgi:hypothetical protein